ncbi:hypothetical protein PXH78_27015 [Mycolicibacterium smegmatis]|uniref:phage tail fiber protein n=1 Tax=Mycolicibacterium smegmatis TaxID=1772 RepID=UPI0005D7E9E9|nr:hypothetical protein [Mycolicibacterium smegmatis]MDF1902764.1 hypothetical protein [Mycolicibacterium smegmatis]MDF1909040.1 hypothetical protein [Mycolicibacterium smegmatis]MDF1921259.1 hypothetical protein [Mycolicibacterium smegmatis]MDF1927524.1 hypothetical protein [Mycolicibacterium smegmatis]UAK53379.1 hypothetical protein K8P01_22575 [Mycolicibacterium smegmatis]
MAVTNATKLAACNAAADRGSWVAVFTNAAGTTGANEATGGSYARKQTSWSDSTNKVVGTEVNIPVAAGTYKEAGIFSASTSGTFVGSGPFDGGDVVVAGAGASIDVTITWS